MTDTLIDCRAAFEKWITDNSQVRKEEVDLLERFPESGHYRWQTTYAGWNAWQEAWKSAQQASSRDVYYCAQEHAGKGRCWNGRINDGVALKSSEISLSSDLCKHRQVIISGCPECAKESPYLKREDSKQARIDRSVLSVLDKAIRLLDDDETTTGKELREVYRTAIIAAKATVIEDKPQREVVKEPPDDKLEQYYRGGHKMGWDSAMAKISPLLTMKIKVNSAVRPGQIWVCNEDKKIVGMIKDIEVQGGSNEG